MTNLIDITDLTEAALDALLGLDAEVAAEADRAEADRRSIAARVRPTADLNTAAAGRYTSPTDAMIDDWADSYEG